MKKKISVLFAVILGLTAALSGCGEGKKEEGQLVPVTLNEVAHSVFYAPQYVAIEEGYFVKEGIKLELVTGFEASIYAYQQGAQDAVVNFAQLTQRAGNFLVAREEMPDFKWSDLKGKDILGGRKGGMPEMVFEYILKQNGLNAEKDLNIDRSIDFGSTAAAFLGGQGDFSVEFEPSATALEQQGAGYVVASCGVDSGYVPYTAYSAKESFMKEKPEIIQGFTNALQKGMDYVNTHTPEKIAKIIKPQFPENDLKTIEMIVKRYQEQGTWKDNLIFEKKSFELLEDILEDAGELEERVPYDKLVNTEFAEKAAKK